MSSIHDQIVAEGGKPALFDVLARTIEWHPYGKESLSQDIEAIVDFSAEDGTNQVQGDGPALEQNNERNRRVRETVHLEVASSLNIRRVQATDPDMFRIDGLKYGFKRVEAHDPVTTKIAAIRSRGGTTRRAAHRG